MKDKRLYLDVHVLQTVPPSCVNRDDTGSPKTAVYGGVIRARVSSQSWKKAMRTMFSDLFPPEELGLRTKKIVKVVAEAIEAAELDVDDPEKAAMIILENAGLKIRTAESGTEALFFISHAQAKALAEAARENPDMLSKNASATQKRELQRALREQPGIDIALFGRMVADDPSLNTDACAQVAHAISTHKVSNEYDYFTAVDDLAPEDSAGAGHLGTVEYNSSTLYRYATLAVHELHRSLRQDTPAVARGFVEAFVRSMPTGKQNTFANRTLPDTVLVTLREDQPVNLVGAFEKPVPSGDSGHVEASVRSLSAHARAVYDDFAGEPALSLVSGRTDAQLGEKIPFAALLDKLQAELRRRLAEGEKTP